MNQNHSNREEKLFHTLKKDISEGGFKSNITNDFGDLKEFFLNSDRKNQLAGMGKIKAFFVMSWWLLKELLLKLNPTRRLVLVIGILLFSVGKFEANGTSFDFSINWGLVGGIIILFILMLELKDKLLAKDELNAGKSVQSALMSERNPKVNGWNLWLFTQPANDVGGDLVDLVKLANGKYGITLADVSGKGLGAALLMAKLQTIVRAFSSEFASVSSFGEKINKVFHKDIMPNSFASLVYIQIEENSNIIEVLNAGHLPPIHISNGSVQQLSKGNIALGLANDSKYRTEKLEINQDDFLLVYSDGVSEARNANSEFYGVDRLLNFVKHTSFNTPEQLGQKLLNHIYSYMGESKRYDDLSIVVLQKKKYISQENI